MAGKWIMDIIIGLFIWIDKVIVKINDLLFGLFVEVSQGRVKSEFFETLLNNLYVIVGIFVLFRVAFSLIQMLANPDMMSDKEKGAGKLATRVVVSFALIVIMPTLFDYAYDLQSAVLQDNLIGRLILGDSGQPDASSNNDAIKSQGQLMSINIFKSMADSGKELGSLTDGNEKYCLSALRSNEYSTITSLERVGNGSTKLNCFTYQVNDEYVYDYKIIVSSLTLGMVAWLMVGFCIDIGVRLIKLTFLQLIAPVCIVSYIGGGKENSFGKWTKMTVSAYVSLFVKLIVIYFIVYFASKVTESIEGITSGLGTVLIYLGLLVFAKNATNLIGDLFGIKMDQESGFKGIAKTALLGAAGLTAAGGLAGLSNLGKGFGDTAKAMGSANGWKGKLGALGKGALGTIGSTVAGTTAGAFYGAKNGFGKNASLGGTINKALMTSRTNRDNRDDRAKVYGGAFKGAWNNLVTDRLKGFVGMDTNAKNIVNQRKSIGEGISRARGNVHYQQQELMLALQSNPNISDARLEELNGYTYNALANNEKGAWFDYNGNEISEQDFMNYYNGLSGDEQAFLDLSKKDGILGGKAVKNASLQGKADTQQKKMEGSNGNK